MSNYMIVDGQLYHHGVKGMKWGVRKTRKWATSKYQPSSAKSSVLAGLYMATGSKKIGKALDRSNDKDAENWKRAKQDYKRIQEEKSKKKQFKKDVEKYRDLRSDFTDSIIESVKNKTDFNKANNVKTMLAVKDYVDNKRVEKGNDYVDQMIRKANKKDKARYTVAVGGFVVTMAAVAVGTAYLESKFGV